MGYRATISLGMLAKHRHNQRISLLAVISLMQILKHLCRCIIIVVLLGTVGTTFAAAGESNVQINDLYNQLDEQLLKIEEIKFSFSNAIGDDKQIVEERLLNASKHYQRLLWKAAEELSKSEGFNEHAVSVNTLLGKESAHIQKEILATRDAIYTLQIELAAYSDTPPPDSLITSFIRRYDILINLYAATLDNISAMELVKLPVQEETQQINRWIQEQADLLMGRVARVKQNIKIHKSQATIYDADTQEHKNAQIKIKGEQLHLDHAAKYLSNMAALVERRGGDASIYQEAVIRATGKLSEDVFDVKVVRRLFVQGGKDFKKWLLVRGPEFLSNIAVFFLTILLASMIARLVKSLLRKMLAQSDDSIGILARDFIVSISSKVVMLLGLIVALSNIGIQLGPILAGVGIMGFIIGFALQDTLSNFASGIMILIYRPYDVGDYIEAAGVEGTVRKMSLVATTVYTVENHRLMLPNNKVWGNIIRNVTSQRVRRVDLMFGVAYDEDIERVKKILHSVLEQHDKVLKSPEAVVRLHELADSSVNFVVRPWVPSDDYWDVYWDLTEQVKLRFDAEGISIPFPQRDIHLPKDETLPT